MPRIADFVVIQDHGVTLPKPFGPVQFIENFTFPEFAAPAASGTPSILSFRLLVEGGTPEFVIEFNGTELFNAVVESGPDRAWHEVISQTQVLAQDNRLRIEIRNRGAATVTVSDVVLFYQAQIP